MAWVRMREQHKVHLGQKPGEKDITGWVANPDSQNTSCRGRQVTNMLGLNSNSRPLHTLATQTCVKMDSTVSKSNSCCVLVVALQWLFVYVQVSSVQADQSVNAKAVMYLPMGAVAAHALLMWLKTKILQWTEFVAAG